MKETDRDKFKGHLNGINPDLRCPVCAGDSWGTSEIAELRTFHGGYLLPRDGEQVSRIYPVAPLFCNNCGYLILFSAITAGLVEAEKA